MFSRVSLVDRSADLPLRSFFALSSISALFCHSVLMGAVLGGWSKTVRPLGLCDFALESLRIDFDRASGLRKPFCFDLVLTLSSL